MPTLTLLAHVSTGLHTHAKGVTFIVLGLMIVAFWFYVKRTA